MEPTVLAYDLPHDFGVQRLAKARGLILACSGKLVGLLRLRVTSGHILQRCPWTSNPKVAGSIPAGRTMFPHSCAERCVAPGRTTFGCAVRFFSESGNDGTLRRGTCHSGVWSAVASAKKC